MKLLFDIDKEGNVMDQDNTIALVPELLEVYNTKNYGSDAIRWIIMMYDYKSPYRNLPIKERYKTVTYKVYKKTKHYILDKPVMKKGIEAFQKLQYDPLIDQYNVYSEKITEFNEVIRGMAPDEANMQKMSKTMEQLGKVTEAREKIKAIILKNEESDAKIHGMNGSFSILESRQRL